MSDLSLAQPITMAPNVLHWTARHGKSIIFAIITLVAVGVYLAVSIPVSVFPNTDFPRIVVGADVGVYPIDQMLVSVTQPLEEALNTVPGLDHVSSITSRGSAEIDLFFDWNVDMDRTLQLANAGLSASTADAARQCEGDRQSAHVRGLSHYWLQSDLGQNPPNHSVGTCKLHAQAPP